MKSLCARQARRRAFTLLELLIVLGIIGILAAILVPVFTRSRESGGNRRICSPNLKQIGLGFMQYAQDYDERFPPTSVHMLANSTSPFLKPYGWADALQPYMKSAQIYHCPTNAESFLHSEDATQAGFTDYWLNTNAAGRALKYFGSPAQTLLCGEGNDGIDVSNARYNRNAFPQSWFDNEGSPARRHLDGANYLFADGHVKWFSAQRDTVAGRINQKWFRL